MSAESRFGSLFTCAILCLCLAATAQVPEDLRKKLLEIGFGPSLEPSISIYEPLLAAAPKGDLVIEKDIRYGEHERNLLDLYRPRIHINTGDELLGREILDFIAEGARRQRKNARAR